MPEEKHVYVRVYDLLRNANSTTIQQDIEEERRRESMRPITLGEILRSYHMDVNIGTIPGFVIC